MPHVACVEVDMDEVYEASNIAEFEMEILARGEHKVFLPVAFLIEGGRLTARANLSGYRRLERADLNSPLKLLEFFEKLCQNLDRAENYLFDTSEIKFSAESFFLDKQGGLRLNYSKDEEKLPVCERIDKLANEIKEEFLQGESKDENEYLEMFKKELLQHPSLSKLANLAGKIKRDAYYCGYR